jgi:uncharacterized protein YkwD
MEVPKPSSKNEVAALRKEKAKWRLIAIAVVIVIFAAAYWYFERSFSLPFESIASFEYALTNKVDNNFSAPADPPEQLAGGTAAKGINTLTRAGVIANTNLQRAANGGLPALAENTTLDDIATLRIDDMFENQYFAHVSPDGASAESIATSVGYEYLALGENLALGNFAGDNGVVTAWMNSPGHRANILDIHYSQIGVAVREGLFHGQNTWIAVQVFGKPTSDCASPDSNLKMGLDTLEAEISTMAAQLQQSKTSIEAMQPQSGSDYNQAVSNYNALATQYNDLTAQAKTDIANYNAGVNAFNTCLDS